MIAGLPSDPSIAFYAITLFGLVYGVVSNQIFGALGKRERQQWIQKEMNRINKLSIDAAKPDASEPLKKEAAAEQDKLTGLLKESMILQFKPLAVILPLFMGASWLVKEAYPWFEIKLTFSIPIFIYNLERFPNWRDTFGPLGWFILAVFFGGMAVNFIAGQLKRVARKNEEKK